MMQECGVDVVVGASVFQKRNFCTLGESRDLQAPLHGCLRRDSWCCSLIGCFCHVAPSGSSADPEVGAMGAIPPSQRKPRRLISLSCLKVFAVGQTKETLLSANTNGQSCGDQLNHELNSGDGRCRAPCPTHQLSRSSAPESILPEILPGSGIDPGFPTPVLGPSWLSQMTDRSQRLPAGTPDLDVTFISRSSGTEDTARPTG
jgi:hypothetical protein